LLTESSIKTAPAQLELYSTSVMLLCSTELRGAERRRLIRLARREGTARAVVARRAKLKRDAATIVNGVGLEEQKDAVDHWRTVEIKRGLELEETVNQNYTSFYIYQSVSVDNCAIIIQTLCKWKTTE
jgi:hypothetical protein